MSFVVEKEVLSILEQLRNEYPQKSPYIFGEGFRNSGFKTFSVDDEMVVPGSICINSYVLKVLSDYKTSFHISNYMKESDRSATIAPNMSRTACILLMLSSVDYSFHAGTFPFCNNAFTNQMWADIGQMIKGSHVCCTLLALATRGRSHVGFSKAHAARSSVPQVEFLKVPTFESNPRQTPIQRSDVLKVAMQQPPAQAEAGRLPTPPDQKTFASAVMPFRE